MYHVYFNTLYGCCLGLNPDHWLWLLLSQTNKAISCFAHISEARLRHIFIFGQVTWNEKDRVRNILSCHLPRGSKLRWNEDMGGKLPSARVSHVCWSLQPIGLQRIRPTGFVSLVLDLPSSLKLSQRLNTYGKYAGLGWVVTIYNMLAYLYCIFPCVPGYILASSSCVSLTSTPTTSLKCSARGRVELPVPHPTSTARVSESGAGCCEEKLNYWFLIGIGQWGCHVYSLG